MSLLRRAATFVKPGVRNTVLMEQETFIEDSIPEDQSPQICEKR
jgi:hypothetical protein